jgi:hypothetical protein
MRAARAELVLAVVAVAGCVLSWLAASSTVVVAPVLDGEPQTTTVGYSAPLLVLSLFLATTAGVLVVLGVARLRRRRAEMEFPVAEPHAQRPWPLSR